MNTERVLKIVAEYYGKDPVELKPAMLFLSLGMFSIDFIAMIHAIEQEFNVELTQQQIIGINSIQDLIEAVS